MTESNPYEDLVETSSYKYPEHKEMLDIVLNFVIRKRLVIFGGLAMDFSLKSVGHQGIYKDTKLMDIDVFSDNHYEDAYELLQTFINLGYESCDLINALHPTSMRVRINQYTLFDISYCPKEIFNMYKNTAIEYTNGALIRHPYIQFLDIHRSLSYPYENRPRENITNRFAKDYKRYFLLYKYFPMDETNSYFNEFVFNSGSSDSKLNKSSKYTHKIDNTNNYIGGSIAYAFYENLFNEIFPEHNITFEPIDISIDGDSVTIPVDLDICYSIYEKDLKINDADNPKFYSKYMDIIPKSVKIGNVKYLFIDEGNELSYTEINGYKVVSIHFVFMWVLYRWFSTKKIIYMNLYRNLYNMIEYIGTIPKDTVIKNKDAMKLYPSIKIDMYLEEIKNTKLDDSLLPKKLYYTITNGMDGEYEPFKYEGNPLFNISGKKL